MKSDRKKYHNLTVEQIKCLRALEQANPDFEFENLPVATMKVMIDSRLALSMAIHEARQKAFPNDEVVVSEVSSIALYVVETLRYEPALARRVDVYGMDLLLEEVNKHIALREERNREMNRAEIKGLGQ